MVGGDQDAGKVLRQLRMEAGLSRKMLADRVSSLMESDDGGSASKGISASMIGRYERGESKISRPAIRRAYKIIFGQHFERTYLSSSNDGSGADLMFNNFLRCADKKRLEEVGARYKGKYLLYRNAYRKGFITTVLLDIGGFDEIGSVVNYSSFQRSGSGLEIRGEGVVLPGTRSICLLGAKKQTALLEMAMLLDLEEGYSFNFLHGLALSTTVAGDMFSTKIVCLRMPDHVTEKELDKRIGNFLVEEVNEEVGAYIERLKNRVDDGGVLKPNE